MIGAFVSLPGLLIFVVYRAWLAWTLALKRLMDREPGKVGMPFIRSSHQHGFRLTFSRSDGKITAQNNLDKILRPAYSSSWTQGENLHE
jgi:hypothetical protein